MQIHFLYRILFAIAACYNTVFAVLLLVKPSFLFGLIHISVPFPDVFIVPLSIGILLFVPMYLYAIVYPEKSRTWITLCLLAKLVSPFVTFLLIFAAGWPVVIVCMTFFNDIIWWIPFIQFLRNRAVSFY